MTQIAIWIDNSWHLNCRYRDLKEDDEIFSVNEETLAILKDQKTPMGTVECILADIIIESLEDVKFQVENKIAFRLLNK